MAFARSFLEDTVIIMQKILELCFIYTLSQPVIGELCQLKDDKLQKFKSSLCVNLKSPAMNLTCIHGFLGLLCLHGPTFSAQFSKLQKSKCKSINLSICKLCMVGHGLKIIWWVICS